MKEHLDVKMSDLPPPEILNKREVLSQVQLHPGGLHAADSPPYEKTIKEATKEEQINYLAQVVRVNNERHIQEKKELTESIKALEDMNAHLVKKLVRIRQKLKDAHDETFEM